MVYKLLGDLLRLVARPIDVRKQKLLWKSVHATWTRRMLPTCKSVVCRRQSHYVGLFPSVELTADARRNRPPEGKQ